MNEAAPKLSARLGFHLYQVHCSNRRNKDRFKKKKKQRRSTGGGCQKIISAKAMMAIPRFRSIAKSHKVPTQIHGELLFSE